MSSTNDWKDKLSPEQYHILGEKGTETPFSGRYNLNFEDGDYSCAGCGEKLFKPRLCIRKSITV